MIQTMMCQQYFWQIENKKHISGYHLDIKIKDSYLAQYKEFKSAFNTDCQSVINVCVATEFGPSEIERVRNFLSFIRNIYSSSGSVKLQLLENQHLEPK